MLIEEWRIDGPHGQIPLRSYQPSDLSLGVGLVWLHGGAFVAGDLDMPENDWVARQLAQRGIHVVTVDYRLAPMPKSIAAIWAGAPPVLDSEKPGYYPVASEEVTAAFTWASHQPGKWAFGGASAGANLAAGATLRLRDTGGPLPTSLVLAYPLLHAELPPLSLELDAKARTLPDHAVFWPETVRDLNLNYVQDPKALNDPYAFPGGHDLSGLPATFVLNSDIDTLRASGQQFAAELALAGNDVTVVREEGAWHGHLNTPDTPQAAKSIARIAAYLTTASAESP
jgi:acetyl esterase